MHMKIRIDLKPTLDIAIFLFALLIYSCSPPVPEEKVTKMFMNNSRHSNSNLSSSVTTEPSVLWKVKTGGQVISSPLVADGMVYVGSKDRKLYALDADTGAEKWVFETGASIQSSPAISKGLVMFLSYDGYFYALNQLDGSLAWKFKTEGEKVFEVKDYYNGSFKPDFWDVYLSSAVVKGDWVYFGSSDQHVYALDILSGEVKWKYKSGGSIHSSPAISKNSLVVGSWDSKVYCLDATTGEENWQYQTDKDTAQYIWLGVQASPTVDDSAVYIGSRDAKMYAFNIESGDTLWVKDEFERSWMPSSGASDDKNIYVGSSDSFSFFSIDKQSGEINYATKTNSYTFSSPAIDSTMAYIGSANGRLFGIELSSGKIKWEFKTTGAETDTTRLYDKEGIFDMKVATVIYEGIDDMPTLSALNNHIFTSVGSILSSPTISNQVVYVGSCDGYIYALTDKH